MWVWTVTHPIWLGMAGTTCGRTTVRPWCTKSLNLYTRWTLRCSGSVSNVGLRALMWLRSTSWYKTGVMSSQCTEASSRMSTGTRFGSKWSGSTMRARLKSWDTSIRDSIRILGLSLQRSMSLLKCLKITCIMTDVSKIDWPSGLKKISAAISTTCLYRRICMRFHSSAISSTKRLTPRLNCLRKYTRLSARRIKN